MTPHPILPFSNAEISAHFSQPGLESAQSLASFINQSDPGQLDSIISTIIDQLFLSSFAQRTQIDTLVSFLSSTTSLITPSISHPGQPQSYDEAELYKTTRLRPSTGGGVLSECLSKRLFEALWEFTSRAYTPDEDHDRTRSKKYYSDPSVHATILARAFATQSQVFREPLWREIEDVLMKGLFSGDEQEPAVFIVLSALFLGAGREIHEYLGAHAGQGKAWLWYDDIRTQKDETWGWEDVVDALKKEPRSQISTRLPDFVKASFDLAKEHVGDGKGEMKSWGSEQLASEAFDWISGT